MPEQLAAFMPLVIVLVVFYFFIIRPQQKQQKKRRAMLDSLRKGDKIVTIGGIHGTLTDIKEDTIRLKVADNVEPGCPRRPSAIKRNSGFRSGARLGAHFPVLFVVGCRGLGRIPDKKNRAIVVKLGKLPRGGRVHGDHYSTN